LRASSFMGVLAATGPWFSKLAFAGQKDAGKKTSGAKHPEKDEGKVHVVESTNETVHLGVFDTTLPPIIKIDSGEHHKFS